ncbi:hypothetical protein [Actinomadura sp. 3N508]
MTRNVGSHATGRFLAERDVLVGLLVDGAMTTTEGGAAGRRLIDAVGLL